MSGPALGSLQANLIKIAVDRTTFDFWTDVHVSDHILTAASKFSFSVAILPDRANRESFELRGKVVRQAEALAPGSPVQILVHTAKTGKDVFVMQGRIEEREFTVSEHGAALHVSGSNHMLDIVAASIFPTIAIEGSTLGAIVRQVLGSFGYDSSKIVLSNDANRALLTGKPALGTVLSPTATAVMDTITLREARPQAGETAFAYLERHLRRFGMLMWGTGDGKIVIGAPNYNQKPAYRLACRFGSPGIENNVESATRRESTVRKPSEVHVYGHSYGHDSYTNGVHGVARDDAMYAISSLRPKIIHENSCKTQQECERRARHELSRLREDADVTQVNVRGYASGDGTVYAVDTIADVDFDAGQVHGPLYVIGRSFHRDESGTHTTLEMVPKHTIELQ